MNLIEKRLSLYLDQVFSWSELQQRLTKSDRTQPTAAFIGANTSTPTRNNITH